MEVTIKEEGARLYLAGNTFPIKDAIKGAGGHWDGDRKMWWVGRTKREEIQKAIFGPSTPSRKDDGVYGGPVLGKVNYTGKSGNSASYYVRWAGITATGKDSVRLTNLAGTIDFWASASDVQWTKRYQEREQWTRYGRPVYGTGGYPTLKSIRSFVQDRKDGVPTRQEIHDQVEALNDMDCFQEAANLARSHGIAY